MEPVFLAVGLVAAAVAVHFRAMLYLKHVRAATDGRYYWVQDLADKQAAADLLGTLQLRVLRLLAHIRADPDLATAPNFARLLANYSPGSLLENADDGTTSYSENKGQRIVLCLRTKDASQRLQEPNLLMFVVLHELAHLMTLSVDTGAHSAEFWANFRRLLEVAVKVGVYAPENYGEMPKSYCGLMLNDNPYYD
jgi:hypothetical protein